MKLRPLYHFFSSALFCIFIIMGAYLAGHQWMVYRTAVATTQSLDTLQLALHAMERISAERGYTNSYLGEPQQDSNMIKNGLSHIRARTDDMMQTLFSALDNNASTRERTLHDVILLQKKRTETRQEIDHLLSTPLLQRDNQTIARVIARATTHIPEINRIVQTVSHDIAHQSYEAIDALESLQSISTLRDQAGLLGSILVPAIIAKRPLHSDEVAAFMRTQDHITTLHTDLNRQLAVQALHQTDVWKNKTAMENRYFQKGLPYMLQVFENGQYSGNYHVSTQEMTQRYVAEMESITQLREGLMQTLRSTLQQQQAHAWHVLLIILTLCSIALFFIYIACSCIRTRLLRPLLEGATLLALPREQLYTRTPLPAYKTRDEASHILLSLYAMRLERSNTSHTT